MKKIFYIICALVFVTTPSVYADGEFGENSKTIKQLQQEVKEIEQEKENLKSRIDTLVKNAELREMIRTNLNQAELFDFEKKAGNFINFRKKQNQKLNYTVDTKEREQIITDITKEREQIITDITKEKQVFYKSIINYIKPERLSDFSNFIKKEENYEQQKNSLTSEKEETKEIINKKVDNIQEKIKVHKEFLDESFKRTVEQKFTERFNALEKGKAFSKLSNEKKALVIEKVIVKIESKRKKLEKELQNQPIYYTEVAHKKLEIYKIGIIKLKELQRKYK